jgi:hypothetical protein
MLRARCGNYQFKNPTFRKRFFSGVEIVSYASLAVIRYSQLQSLILMQCSNDEQSGVVIAAHRK